MNSFRGVVSRRGEARTVLATVMIVILGIVALQIAAWTFVGPKAFGQGSPSPTSEFTIQFLNPTQNTSNELSTKNDTTDTQYHFLAWVNKIPPEARVEFKYQASGTGSREIDLGQGTQVNGTDTWELKSDLTALVDQESSGASGTSGVVRAILISGTGEVARDQETVRVNQEPEPMCPSVENPPPDCVEEDQAQTIELTYPANTASLGYYRPNPGNGPINSVFDVTVSAGTQTVESWYTLSLPGTEPTWKQCREGAGAANEATPAETTNGVRCEYAAGDNPASVTAVAVRANDMTETFNDLTNAVSQDTSDAHRVFPYEQEVNTIELAGGTQSVDADKCIPAVTATVKDQLGRKIADTNVDVHAIGPSDDLSFDDSDGAHSSANKPPEDHATESARDCEAASPGFAGSQGEHEVAGPGDLKHIESLNDTDDAGQWKFALHSPISGATQYTAWADEDSNDRLCSLEAQADGSVGWGQAAPAATGAPDQDTSCPRPNPSGSPSSGTGSPSTATTSARPSGTSTPQPPDQRTITFSASDSEVVAGAQVTFAGQIFAPDEDCQNDEFVRISRRVHGERSATEFATTRTNQNGRFQIEIALNASAEYQAISPVHDNCGDAFSSPVNIAVKVRVIVGAKPLSAQRGDTIKIKVRVAPKHAGDKVVLQRRKGGSWVKVDTAKLNRRSRTVFKVPVRWFGPRKFRGQWKSQDEDHEANNSEAVTIRSR